MTKPKKSVEQLASDHVEQQMEVIWKSFESWFAITRKLCKDEFVHGYKHGKEDR